LMMVGEKFEKITEVPKPAATGGEAGGPIDTVRALFEGLPATFKAEKAEGWKANIVFDIGGTPMSLVVKDGSASFKNETMSSPSAKVTFDGPQTVLAMAKGELAPEQAFMSGKVKTDNMGVLMKFGQYFDLEAAASELGSGGDSAKKGLNYDAEGKKFRGSARFVHEEETIAYARATDDDNEYYVDTQREGGIIAPPLFPVKPLFEVLTNAIADDELNADLLRLVHGEQDMRFHRHLKPWDLAAARAQIESIEQKSSGDLIEVRQWLMVDGQMTTEATSGLFIRGEGGGDTKKKDRPEEPERDIIFEEKQVVARDQPKRYADASDDHNPIHVDPEVAKSAGLPSVILHGLCTMAFAGRAVVNGPCDGEPNRLKRLKVRFSKPVLPAWELTTRIWKEDGGVLGLEVVNQDGEKVITNGLAEVEG